MSATVDQVRDVLRAKMLEAKQAGVKIMPHVSMFVEENDGQVCACALGCTTFDRFYRGESHTIGAAMDVLDVSWSIATWIFTGFDLVDLRTLTELKPGATDWHAIGVELRAEFAPSSDEARLQ